MLRLRVLFGIVALCAALCAVMCLAGCGSGGVQDYSGELESPQGIGTDEGGDAASQQGIDEGMGTVLQPGAGEDMGAAQQLDVDGAEQPADGGVDASSQQVIDGDQAATIAYDPEADPDYAEVKAYIQMEATQDEPVYTLSSALQLSSPVSQHDSDGMQVFYLKEQADPGVIVIYLHGGYYLGQIEPAHWTLIDSVVSSTGCQAIVPLYHLAPWGTCMQAYEQLTSLYVHVREQYPQSKVVLLGDSAGGGLALGLAESLAQDGIAGPDELVLLSPWVDATGSNPECLPYQGLDPVLSLAVGKACAEAWADELDVSDWHVSPLFGDVSGLGNVTVFVGTNEMFYPDVLLLADNLQTAGVPVELHVGQGQFHVYPVLQTPAAIEARELITQVVLR